jgi:AbrB family looped-hinge helix DNA binding protein
VNKAVAVTVDSKCRVTIPSAAREALGVGPGTVLFVEREGDVLRLAKAVNPFDGLARHAIEEYRAGGTRNLREFAEEEGISLDGE